MGTIKKQQENTIIISITGDYYNRLKSALQDLKNGVYVSQENGSVSISDNCLTGEVNSRFSIGLFKTHSYTTKMFGIPFSTLLEAVCNELGLTCLVVNKKRPLVLDKELETALTKKILSPAEVNLAIASGRSYTHLKSALTKTKKTGILEWRGKGVKTLEYKNNTISGVIHGVDFFIEDFSAFDQYLTLKKAKYIELIRVVCKELGIKTNIKKGNVLRDREKDMLTEIVAKDVSNGNFTKEEESLMMEAGNFYLKLRSALTDIINGVPCPLSNITIEYDKDKKHFVFNISKITFKIGGFANHSLMILSKIPYSDLLNVIAKVLGVTIEVNRAKAKIGK